LLPSPSYALRAEGGAGLGPKSALILVAFSRARSPRICPWCKPRKFELVINAETARTLGLNIPASLLAVADEVIE
jgi:hypothetical protein